MIEPIKACDETALGIAEGPGAEVPDDRRQQQGKDHRVAGGAADLQDQLHRQQGDDAVGHRAGGEEHAQKVEEAGPHHREERRQAVGVNHRRDRVCRVVEAVHELKRKGDDEGETQQAEDAQRHRLAGNLDVGDQPPEDEGQGADQDHQEERQSAPFGSLWSTKVGRMACSVMGPRFERLTLGAALYRFQGQRRGPWRSASEAAGPKQIVIPHEGRRPEMRDPGVAGRSASRPWVPESRGGVYPRAGLRPDPGVHLARDDDGVEGTAARGEASDEALAPRRVV